MRYASLCCSHHCTSWPASNWKGVLGGILVYWINYSFTRILLTNCARWLLLPVVDVQRMEGYWRFKWMVKERY